MEWRQSGKSIESYCDLTTGSMTLHTGCDRIILGDAIFHFEK